MVEALLGAIVGGLLAIAGGYLAQRWQAQHQSKTIARSILAELESSISDDEYKSSTNFYLDTLENIISTGCIKNRELLLSLIDQRPNERYPIYYANAGSVGNLPDRITQDIVRFHSLATSVAAAGKLLLASNLPPAELSAGAYSIKVKYEELLRVRAQAIAALKNHLSITPDFYAHASAYQPLSSESPRVRT